MAPFVRWFSVLVAIATLVGVTGCGGGKPPQGSPTPQNEAIKIPPNMPGADRTGLKGRGR